MCQQCGGNEVRADSHLSEVILRTYASHLISPEGEL